MTTRRDFLKTMAGGLMAASSGVLTPRLIYAAGQPSLGPPTLPSGALESALLEALPGKQPLIKRSFRPPNYETPVSYFNEAFTSNDAFFVRYHLANIPEVNADSWRLRIGGEAVQTPVELTLAELKQQFEAVEIAAVCQCSGNRRGLSDPHVPGVQWGYGAMGNARWKGARLKDVLDKAGIQKEAVEITFDGADSGVIEKTPDFVKSLPLWKALDQNTLLAYEMNGAPLPHWNGYPVRLVVPGWTATYWVKQLVSVEAVTKPFQGFWMNPAYRIPKGKFPVVDRFLSQETDTNTPITEMVVNSLITNPTEGQKFTAGRPLEIIGIAWDGGYGIQTVEISVNGGATWGAAELAKDNGKYAWRQWRHVFKPKQKGPYAIMAKTTNSIGGSQPLTPVFNPAGYHHNAVQTVNILVS